MAQGIQVRRAKWTALWMNGAVGMVIPNLSCAYACHPCLGAAFDWMKYIALFTLRKNRNRAGNYQCEHQRSEDPFSKTAVLLRMQKLELKIDQNRND